MLSKDIRLTDSEQLAQSYVCWEGQIEQVSLGRLEGRLQIVQGQLVRVATATYNQRIAFRGRDASALIAIRPVIDKLSTKSWLGCSLKPPQVVLSGPDHEICHCSMKRTSDWCMYLPAEILEDAVRTLGNEDVLIAPRESVVYSPPSEAVSRLMRHINRLLNMGLAAPESLTTPECHTLEQDCIQELLAVLTLSVVPPKRLNLPARSELVGRTDEFLRGHLGDSLCILDLCSAIGANDRTLRLAFQEHLGVGPMTYFKLLRLNAVRWQLRNNRELSIRTVAKEFGFRHLGNFAADYRKLFGESPSDTERSHFQS